MRVQFLVFLVWWQSVASSPGLVHPYPEDPVTPGVSSVPGQVLTDWIGNTFGFNELINPAGSPLDDHNRKWVQNFCEHAWVSPGGRVFTHSHWDEGGRGAGIYQDGDLIGSLVPPTKDVFARDGAIIGDNNYVYATSGVDYGNWDHRGFGVRRFHRNGASAPWSAGGGISESYLLINPDVKPPSPAKLALDRSRNELFVMTEDSMLVFDTVTMSQTPIATIPLAPDPENPSGPRLIDLVSDGNGKLWVMRQRGLIERTDHRMVPDGTTISGDFGPHPRLGMATDGRLMVWDDRLLQVRFYSNPGTGSQVVSTFGAPGGIYGGVRGQRQPDKLLPRATSLGTDSDGNIYMTWGSAFAPSFTEIRSWNPQGELRWEVMGHLFVHCGGFDPATDGQRIYSTQVRYDMDYSKPIGKKWTYTAFHHDRDDAAEPGIPAIGGGVIIRMLEGKRVFAKSDTDLYAYGLRFYIENEDCLNFVDRVTGYWAWWFDTNGDVWWGDAKINGVEVIVRYPFTGWVDGKPRWDWANPQTWPNPGNYPINRIYYNPETDVLILTGGSAPGAGGWGRAGQRMTRYNGWRSGDQTFVWQIDLPTDSFVEGPVDYFKAFWVEGDYIFLAAATAEPRSIHLFRIEDGSRVGHIVPGPEVGGDIRFGGAGYGRHGWTDMVWAVQAIKRQDGSYAILFEDDMNAKNNLYLWYPDGVEPPPEPPLTEMVDELGETIPAFRTGIHQCKVENVGGYTLSADSTKAVPLTTTVPGTLTWQVDRVDQVTATVGIRSGQSATFTLASSSNGVDFTPISGAATPGATGEYWQVWTYLYDAIPNGTTHFRATLSAVDCENFWDITLGRISFHLMDNQPPILSPVGSRSIDAGQLLQFQISGSDPEGESLHFSASGGVP